MQKITTVQQSYENWVISKIIFKLILCACWLTIKLNQVNMPCKHQQQQQLGAKLKAKTTRSKQRNI